MKKQNLQKAIALSGMIDVASERIRVLTNSLGSADKYTFRPILKDALNSTSGETELETYSDIHRFGFSTVDEDLVRDLVAKEIAVVQSQIFDWSKELESL